MRHLRCRDFYSIFMRLGADSTPSRRAAAQLNGALGIGPSSREQRVRSALSAGRGWIGCVDSGAGQRLRRAGEAQMNWSYLISGLIAVGLLVYLVVALIRAEDL